ncbi:MAG: hypothetical protein ACOCRA_01000 [Halobacteria archaeon]
MAQKQLVDRLVVEEYRDFADDPLRYATDRKECVGRLVSDGVKVGDAEDAWREFERRYLVRDGGGLTFSAHGIDRANALGETVYVDEEARAEIVDTLQKEDSGRKTFESLANQTGMQDESLKHNLWMLRRRGIVETRTDVYGDGRSVVLTEP